MSDVKQRLLGRIRAATKGKRGFEAARALDHLQAAFYTWTLNDDHIEWSPGAKRVLDLHGKALPLTGRAFATMIEPGCGMGRADAIAADSVVSHPRGMPYQLSYGLRLDDNTIVAVEDRGRWFADRNGFPINAHGSLSITGPIDPQFLPAETIARSEFLAAITRGAGMRGVLRNVGVLAVNAELVATSPGSHPGIHDHPQGGELLDAVVIQARRLMRRNDQILLQSDGTILLALMSSSITTLEQAAGHLRKCVESRSLMTSDGTAALALRIGIAAAPDHAATALQLTNHAEEALHNANTGNEPVVIFSGIDRSFVGMERALTTFLSATELLSDETLHDQMVLAHRPLFDAGSRLAALHMIGPGRRVGCEVSAAEDLRFSAEAAGLSQRLDRHLLDRTCDELALCHDQYAVLPVSTATLADPEWTVALAAFVGAKPGVASRLIIGIPERFAAADLDLLDRRMNTMKALGVGIAILDFGAGHMPCTLFSQLPIDMVVFDGALVQNAAACTDNRFYLRGLIDIAQGRDIVIATPWVEDERTAAMLSEWGANYLEGRIRPSAVEAQPEALRLIA